MHSYTTHDVSLFQLLAYARGAQGSSEIEKTNPELKGHTLPQNAVEPPLSFVNTNDPPELVIGEILFGIMYLVNALISLSVGIMLLPRVFDVYDRNVIPKEGFLKDPIRVQWLTAALLAGAYFLAVIGTDAYFLSVNVKSFNLFILLKLLFSFIPLLFAVISSICYWCKKSHAEYYTSYNKCGTAFNECGITFIECDTNSNVFILFRKITLVVTVWLGIYLLSLSIVPTVLLLCAYPMNTFALIVIHVALIYFEIKVGTFVFMMLNVWEISFYRENKDFLWLKCMSCRSNRIASLQDDKPTCVCRVLRIGTVIIFMLFVLAVVYFTFIWFYQFILLRSVSSNVAVDIILKYLPSAVIGLFGFFISKGTPYGQQRIRRASFNIQT